MIMVINSHRNDYNPFMVMKTITIKLLQNPSTKSAQKNRHAILLPVLSKLLEWTG